MTRRHALYFAIRGGCAVVFVLAATVLPRGVPAALVIVAAGVVGVASCLFANAGSPGELAGARAQDRWFDSVRAPQGEWPPYELPVQPSEATVRPTAAS